MKTLGTADLVSRAGLGIVRCMSAGWAASLA